MFSPYLYHNYVTTLLNSLGYHYQEPFDVSAAVQIVKCFHYSVVHCNKF